MKTNAFKKIFVLIAAIAFSIYQVQSQPPYNVTSQNGSQDAGYVSKFQTFPGNIEKTVTPIFEDIFTLRIGIGTTSPQQQLSINHGMNIDQSNGNTGTLSNALTFGSSSGEGIGSKKSSGGNVNGLDFYTSGNNRMSVMNGGNVGIGITTPTEKLQVVSGNIDVNTSTNQYMINQSPVLWHNGNALNLFAGVDAGNSGTMGDNNTFIGNNAGHTNAGTASTNGDLNTFVGSRAGFTNSTGRGNTFIGRRSGELNTIGRWNTCVGTTAGYSNTTGEVNAFFGKEAGYLNTTGIGNTFLGGHAGENNTTGYWNVIIGFNSGGANYTGILNTWIGAGTNGTFLQTNLENTTAIGGGCNVYSNNTTAIGVGSLAEGQNSTAIGYTAHAPSSYSMILGDNNIKVAIGMSGISGGPWAKLQVQRKLGDITPLVSKPTSIYSFNDDEDMDGLYSGNSYGVNSQVLGRNLFNYGGWFEPKNATINTGSAFITTGAYTGGADNQLNNSIVCQAFYGLRNIGIVSVAGGGNQSTGGHFEATGAQQNFAVSGSAQPSPGSILDVAVFGSAPTNPVQPPIFPAPLTGSWAGFFNGDLGYTGNFWFMSDSSIKTNIEPLEPENVNAILSQLNSYSYNFDTTALQNIKLPTSLQFGFIAQELDSVAPNLVLNTITPAVMDSLGNVITQGSPVKMINPIGIIALLVSGYNQLKAQMEECCLLGFRGTGSSTPLEQNRQTIQLKSDEAILFQNIPNPFNNTTIINYFIPQNTGTAKIIFMDNTGKAINEIVISEKLQGSLQVNAEQLNSGIYTYSLMCDGKIVDSKKMVRSN